MSSLRPGRPTGKTFAGGLPSNPRARSVGRHDTRERETERYRDRTRERDIVSDYYSDPYRGAPSPTPTNASARTAPIPSMRSHRSMTNMSSSSRSKPSTSSSYTRVPDVPPLPHPRRSNESSTSSVSAGSYYSTSGSSSSSAFLDRMKGRGGYGNGYGSGYGSSRTSVEEEEPELEMVSSRNPKRAGPDSERGGWARPRMAAMTEPEYGSDEIGDGDDSLPGSQSGYGLSLWSRVATAASTLTISVSKAWASNIIAHPGERTPPGEESRLTRALKAYHIDKARDPTDLPEWLFEEHERRPIGRSGTNFRHREEDGYFGEHEHDRATRSTTGSSSTPPRPSGRGLRDAYDTATRELESSTSSYSHSRAGRPQQYLQDDDVPTGSTSSKAHDRLKALRDAKRQAALRNASVSSVHLPARDGGDEWAVRSERGRSLVVDRGRGGDGPHRRAPSLPATVRPPRGAGLPARPGVRKI